MDACIRQSECVRVAVSLQVDVIGLLSESADDLREVVEDLFSLSLAVG